MEQIAYNILAYLAENPDAQDTMEGIIGWWLSGQARNSSPRRDSGRHQQGTRLLMKVITGQVVAGEDRAAALRLRLRIRQQVYVRDIAIPLPQAGARGG